MSPGQPSKIVFMLCMIKPFKNLRCLPYGVEKYSVCSPLAARRAAAYWLPVASIV